MTTWIKWALAAVLTLIPTMVEVEINAEVKLMPNRNTCEAAPIGIDAE